MAKSIYARPQKGAVARTQSPLKGAFTASSIAKVEDALKAKVVVVDDSATIRKIMRSILTPEFGFEVVAEAEDPTRLREIISKTDADLVTLDLHMPKMDGMTYLMNGLDEAHPPVVVLSSLSRSEGSKVLQCLEYGACDYIEKPRSNNFSESAELIRSALRGALQAKRSKAKPNDPVKVEAVSYQSSVKRRDLIVLGASTGGVDAIRQILPAFPLNSPPIVIVQHIPAVFSELMAERLCDVTKLIVKEAKDGDALLPGHVYIAPGGQQIELHSLGGQSKIVVSEAQTRLVYNPCIDFFFDSVARVAQLHHLTVSAAILTGMGRDGALGLKALKAMGAFTVAQDEATSVIYGMPRAAFELGAANLVCPLSQIPSELIKGLQNSKRAVA